MFFCVPGGSASGSIPDGRILIKYRELLPEVLFLVAACHIINKIQTSNVKGDIMLIFRHHKGSLSDSMKTCKEFNNFQELQEYIVKYMQPYMDLVLSDVVASNEKTNDLRIGWEDSDYICIAGYNKVSDKEGFERYFGGKYESDCCIGMFATKYPK